MFKKLSAFVHSLVHAHHARRDPEMGMLKAENRMFRHRRSGKYIVPSDAERRELMAWGAKLNHEVDGILSCVSIETYKRWVREEAQGKTRGQVGRKPTGGEVEELVLSMKRENPVWGYSRLLGELRKLGHKIGRMTIRRILRRGGQLDPPKPEKGPWKKPDVSWRQFLAMHAETTLACDFFHKRVWSWRGPRDAVMLAVLHIGSRRVHYSNATFNPDRAWLAQQARNIAMWAEDEGIKPDRMILDNDQIYKQTGFDGMLKGIGVEPVHTPLHSPTANAFCESHIGKLKHECLNHFVCVSLSQLDYIVEAWRKHFLLHRPHQGIGNKPLDRSFVPDTEGPVKCVSSLGGLLQSYYRECA